MEKPQRFKTILSGFASIKYWKDAMGVAPPIGAFNIETTSVIAITSGNK